MRKFTTVHGIAAPLNEDNIDTDALLPARFLLLMDKVGFGKHLFSERRRDKNFILNVQPYNTAEIIIAGPRFGIGSSREHAVWALADFGIRCILAPSFGDILFANCIKNVILPIQLGEADHGQIMQCAIDGRTVTINLETQTISSGDISIKFDVKPFHKRTLLLGLDETQSILSEDIKDILAFERGQKDTEPWLYLSPEQLSIFNDTKKSLP